jgi:hypothetical protein
VPRPLSCIDGDSDGAAAGSPRRQNRRGSPCPPAHACISSGASIRRRVCATLACEVRNDVAYGGMRWITVGPADQPGTSIVLSPPAGDPSLTDDEGRTIVALAGRSDRDDGEGDGKRASLFMAGARRPLRDARVCQGRRCRLLLPKCAEVQSGGASPSGRSRLGGPRARRRGSPARLRVSGRSRPAHDDRAVADFGSWRRRQATGRSPNSDVGAYAGSAQWSASCGGRIEASSWSRKSRATASISLVVS